MCKVGLGVGGQVEAKVNGRVWMWQVAKWNDSGCKESKWKESTDGKI